jgi:sugar lactone lactonase YvrE
VPLELAAGESLVQRRRPANSLVQLALQTGAAEFEPSDLPVNSLLAKALTNLQFAVLAQKTRRWCRPLILDARYVWGGLKHAQRWRTRPITPNMVQRHMRPLTWNESACAVFVCMLGASVLACSDAPAAPRVGRLVVSITAPAGVTPSVVVNGPGGYQQTLTKSDTLSGLMAGTYTVRATNVVNGDPVVSTVETGVITGSPAALGPGEVATAAVTYRPRPGSGALWIVGNIDTTTNLAYAFGPGALLVSGAPAPSVALQVPHIPTHNGDVDAIAFDTAGNLWLGHYQLNTVTEVPAQALATSGAVSEAITIGGNGLRATQGLAFDAHGNLWVSNNLPIGQGYTIVEYSAAQLSVSGSPVPVVTLSGTALQGPEQIAFDPSGDLWVANSGTSDLIEYTPAQLASGGDQVPAMTLSAIGGSLNVPISLAFDHNGNLWVANATGASGNTIVEFPPSALTTSGAPVPTMTITLSTFPVPWQLAFDNSGDLWVVTSYGHTLLQYTVAQLAAGGNPSPAVTIALGSIYGGGLAFNPHASALPLR